MKITALFVLVVLLLDTSRIFAANSSFPEATVVEFEGLVQTSLAREPTWRPTITNEWLVAHDRIRTREESRAALRLKDRSLFRLNELSELSIQASENRSTPTALELLRGALLFLHRGKPKDVEIRTRSVSAAIRGTEFHLEVDDSGKTVLTLFDGEVTLSNPQGILNLQSGEQATIELGEAPRKTPLLVPKHDLIQWCLYYPGVLDPDELNLASADTLLLATSLDAYRTGNLLQALQRMPSNFQSTNIDANIYHAALLLSVGRVDSAQTLISSLSTRQNGDPWTSDIRAQAIHQLIDLVKDPSSATNSSFGEHPDSLHSATALLVQSYRAQSLGHLEEALHHARRSLAISPRFAFAATRVAELEFSFGRIRPAQQALSLSLKMAPENAQAVALRGFLLASENRTSAALKAFDNAISLDGALGNAWLGRGLCYFRINQLERGTEDLQIAATRARRRSKSK